MRMRSGILLIVAVMVSSAQGEIRTWTSVTGTTLDGEYVRSDARIVVLRCADGDEYRVRLNSLSDEDQDFVRDQRATPVPSFLAREEPEKNDSIQLTEEQIAALKTEVEVRPGTKFGFTGSFGNRRLNEQELRRLRPNSPVAYRITADFFEAQQGRGDRWTRRRIDTRVQFYLLDAEGNVLVYRTESIANLCPT